MENTSENKPGLLSELTKGRSLLTIFISTFSLIALWILGSRALAILDNHSLNDAGIEKRIQGIQTIISSILPVIAAWMGTVIAFYFGRENFEAVTKSMQNVINKLTPEEKLKSIPANSVMLKYDRIKTMNVTPASTLASIVSFLNTSGINRLPIFDANDKIQYCIHQSSFEKFIANFSISPPSTTTATVATLTLNDLTSDGTFVKSNLDGSVQIVKPDASLLDAKKAMETSPNCQDVFVTEDGTINSKVLGWITNNTIIENANV